MKLLLVCILLLSHPLTVFRFLFYQYMVVFLFNIVIYVFLLLGVCILIVRLPWLRFFLAFSSVVRQMPGYNSPKRGTACTLPKFMCFSMYCLLVNVYCTTATGWQPNCTWQIYHIVLYIISHIISYHIIYIISYIIYIISYIISYISYHISFLNFLRKCPGMYLCYVNR
jgi:hypothetical protein